MTSYNALRAAPGRQPSRNLPNNCHVPSSNEQRSDDAHTDETGTENSALSEERSGEAFNQLVTRMRGRYIEDSEGFLTCIPMNYRRASPIRRACVGKN